LTVDNKAVEVATKIKLQGEEKMKKNYTFYIDSYGTDALGCACVHTKKITVKAKNDRGAKQIARNRQDVSKIIDIDGNIIMDGDYPYCTSRYCVGC
jgi:hypothetical protein